MQQKECRNYAASGVSQTPKHLYGHKECVKHTYNDMMWSEGFAKCIFVDRFANIVVDYPYSERRCFIMMITRMNILSEYLMKTSVIFV